MFAVTQTYNHCVLVVLIGLCIVWVWIGKGLETRYRLVADSCGNCPFLGWGYSWAWDYIYSMWQLTLPLTHTVLSPPTLLPPTCSDVEEDWRGTKAVCDVTNRICVEHQQSRHWGCYRERDIRVWKRGTLLVWCCYPFSEERRQIINITQTEDTRLHSLIVDIVAQQLLHSLFAGVVVREIFTFLKWDNFWNVVQQGYIDVERQYPISGTASFPGLPRFLRCLQL